MLKINKIQKAKFYEGIFKNISFVEIKISKKLIIQHTCVEIAKVL
jgi:hypothetical protein